MGQMIIEEDVDVPVKPNLNINVKIKYKTRVFHNFSDLFHFCPN